MEEWSSPASQARIDAVVAALKEHGIEAVVVDTPDEAKAAALALIPHGAEVMTMTSETLEQTGIAAAINQSGDYDSVRDKLNALDRATQGPQMQKLGAAPEYVIGSVHAVTEDGQVVIASRSGSQLPAYAYGSAHVIWVVGSQKLVKDLPEAMARIEQHTLPLESLRVQKAYGMPNSEIRKLLIMKKEEPGRITMVIIKDAIGY